MKVQVENNPVNKNYLIIVDMIEIKQLSLYGHMKRIPNEILPNKYQEDERIKEDHELVGRNK